MATYNSVIRKVDREAFHKEVEHLREVNNDVMLTDLSEAELKELFKDWSSTTKKVKEGLEHERKRPW